MKFGVDCVRSLGVCFWAMLKIGKLTFTKRDIHKLISDAETLEYVEKFAPSIEDLGQYALQARRNANRAIQTYFEESGRTYEE